LVKDFNMAKINKLLLAILFISLNLNIILVYFIYLRQNRANREQQTLQTQKYPYLSKRIFIAGQNDILINFTNLRKKLTDYSQSIKEKLGFYFEYLPSGASIGINEKEEFIPASLLKVPLVMAVYKEIEKGILFHQQEYTVKKEYLDSSYGDLWRKGEGTKLTLDEAIRLTLVESDNTAKNVLSYNLPQGSTEDIFLSLDIPVTFENQHSVVTPKNYTSILRSLFLSLYLSEENSNEILNIMTQSGFNEGIVAGVAKEIKVAHKIGIVNPNSQTETITTDCGIVYIPSRPYTLCIMIQAPSEKAQQYMSQISKIIYDDISSSKP